MVLVCQSRGLSMREDKTKPAKGQDEVGLPYLVCDHLFREMRCFSDMLALGGMEVARQLGGFITKKSRCYSRRVKFTRIACNPIKFIANKRRQ